MEFMSRDDTLSASMSFSGSPAPSSAEIPASPQQWGTSPYQMEHEDTHLGMSSSLMGFPGPGTSSNHNQMTQFGRGNLSSNFQFDMTGVPSAPYISSISTSGQRHFGQMALPGSILSGTLGSPGTDAPATPSDRASDKASIADSPQWEDVQIPSILENAPYNDQSDAWINEHQILQVGGPSTHPALIANSPSASNQMVRSSSTISDLDVVKHPGRRPFSDKQLRDETSATRKLKACVRCRFQKTRVSDVSKGSTLY
jgi:hypothetical protein